MFIYKITNLKNNKCYIGQTVVGVEQRFAGHKSGDSIVARAIRKHGLENFKVETLEQLDCLEDLNNREIYWIAHFNSTIPNGYNIRSGGMSGGKLSEQTKRKISEIQTGRTWVERMGEEKAEKQRKKHSERSSGKNNNMYGKQLTEEQSLKRKQSMQKNYDNPEYIEKLRKASVAGLEKRTLAVKEYYSNKELVNKRHEKFFRKIECIQTGEIFNSYNEIKTKYNFSKADSGNLCAVLNKKRKTVRGLSFIYLESPKRSYGNKPQQVICIDDGTIYEDALIASQEIGCAYNSLIDVLSGRRNSVFNKQFKYLKKEKE